MKKYTYVIVLLFTFIGLISLTSLGEGKVEEVQPAHLQSESALKTMLQVLKHERCMNCHPSGDRPRQGNDAHLHLFNVQRGPDNQGLATMRCISCHQRENNLASNVPGAPHWQLAPRSMGWYGLTDEELITALLDKKKNGNRSVEDLVHHMTQDSLVQWAWNPGEGLTIPPVSQEEFHQAVITWASNGAPVK